MEGAEGKIKGGGVTPMLTHCLHIVFRNSTAEGLGVTGLAFFPAMRGKNGGVTLCEANALSLYVARFGVLKNWIFMGIIGYICRSLWRGFRLPNPSN